MEKDIKITNILLGLLLVAIIVFGGLFVYKEFIDKDEKDTTKNDSNEKITLDIKDSDVQLIINKFHLYSDDIDSLNDYTKLESDNDQRMALAYQNLASTHKSTINCKEVSEKYLYDKEGDMYGLCGEPFSAERFKPDCFEGTDFKFSTTKCDEYYKNNNVYANTVEGAALKEKYIELFGKNYEYKTDNWLWFHYENGKFISYAEGSGDVVTSNNVTITSVYKIENKLYIELSEKNDFSGEGKFKYEFELENGNYVFVTKTKINN